jgi:hypothetical protein
MMYVKNRGHFEIHDVPNQQKYCIVTLDVWGMEPIALENLLTWSLSMYIIIKEVQYNIYVSLVS